MTWPKQYGDSERSTLDRYILTEEFLSSGAPVAARTAIIDKPLIAQIQGFAMGLMCDIRIMAESAKFSESYINVGIVSGDGASYFYRV